MFCRHALVDVVRNYAVQQFISTCATLPPMGVGPLGFDTEMARQGKIKRRADHRHSLKQRQLKGASDGKPQSLAPGEQAPCVQALSVSLRRVSPPPDPSPSPSQSYSSLWSTNSPPPRSPSSLRYVTLRLPWWRASSPRASSSRASSPRAPSSCTSSCRTPSSRAS